MNKKDVETTFRANFRLAEDAPNTYPHVTSYSVRVVSEHEIVVDYTVNNGRTLEERGTIYRDDW